MHLVKFLHTPTAAGYEVGPLFLSKGLNVIFGLNGAGKSRTLSRILRFGRMHKESEASLTGTVECVIQDGNDIYDYRVVSEYDANTNRVKILHDYLMKNSTITLFDRDTRTIFDELTGQLVSYSPEEGVISMNYAQDTDRHKTIQHIKSFLTTFRAFDDSLDLTAHRRHSEDEDIYDGSDLETLLLDLFNNYKDQYDDYKRDLSEIIPSIVNIETERLVLKDGRVLEHVYIDEGLGRYFYNFASAGYKKVLILLVLLHHPRATSTIILDEVEDGLDYNVLRKILELLQRMAYQKQIIITTHSPNLANQIDLEKWHIAIKNANAVKFYRVKQDDHLLNLKRLGTPNYDLFVKELLALNEEVAPQL